MLTLIRFPFHPSVTAMELKRFRSFCQKCRWQVHLNTHRPLTQRSRSGLTLLPWYRVGTYQGNELTRNSSGRVHSRLSLLSHCGLILVQRRGLVCASWSPRYKYIWITELSFKILEARKKLPNRYLSANSYMSI